MHWGGVLWQGHILPTKNAAPNLLSEGTSQAQVEPGFQGSNAKGAGHMMWPTTPRKVIRRKDLVTDENPGKDFIFRFRFGAPDAAEVVAAI